MPLAPGHLTNRFSLSFKTLIRDRKKASQRVHEILIKLSLQLKGRILRPAMDGNFERDNLKGFIVPSSPFCTQTKRSVAPEIEF